MKRTSEGDALTELILETFRLNGRLLDAGNQLTEPHGLTSARWQVMGAARNDNSPLTVAQIARRMGLVRQGVQRIVNELEELGFVVLEENIDHKRAKLVRLTKSGEKVLSLVQKDQMTWVNALSKGMNKSDLNRAVKTMQAVRQRLVDAESD